MPEKEFEFKTHTPIEVMHSGDTTDISVRLVFVPAQDYTGRWSHPKYCTLILEIEDGWDALGVARWRDVTDVVELSKGRAGEIFHSILVALLLQTDAGLAYINVYNEPYLTSDETKETDEETDTPSLADA